MAERHVVAALVAKRAEIAGLVVEVERRLDALRTDLGHVDAVPRLFDPTAKPEAIRAKRPRVARGGLAGVKLLRRALDRLRTTDRRLTALDLARKGLENAGNGGDEAAEKVLARKIGKLLDHHRRRGVFVSSEVGGGMLGWGGGAEACGAGK